MGFTCKQCGNDKEFVAAYTIQAECIVDAHGNEVIGIKKEVFGKHINGAWDLIIETPYKCFICGSTEIIKEDIA